MAILKSNLLLGCLTALVISGASPATAMSVWWGFPTDEEFLNDTGLDANDLHLEWEINGAPGDVTLPRLNDGPFPISGAFSATKRAAFSGATVANGASIHVNLFFKLEDDGRFPNIVNAYWTDDGTNIGGLSDIPAFTQFERKVVFRELGLPTPIPIPAAGLLLFCALGALRLLGHQRQIHEQRPT